MNFRIRSRGQVGARTKPFQTLAPLRLALRSLRVTLRMDPFKKGLFTESLTGLRLQHPLGMAVLACALQPPPDV